MTPAPTNAKRSGATPGFVAFIFIIIVAASLLLYVAPDADPHKRSAARAAAAHRDFREGGDARATIEAPSGESAPLPSEKQGERPAAATNEKAQHDSASVAAAPATTTIAPPPSPRRAAATTPAPPPDVDDDADPSVPGQLVTRSVCEEYTPRRPVIAMHDSDVFGLVTAKKGAPPSQRKVVPLAENPVCRRATSLVAVRIESPEFILAGMLAPTDDAAAAAAFAAAALTTQPPSTTSAETTSTAAATATTTAEPAASSSADAAAPTTTTTTTTSAPETAAPIPALPSLDPNFIPPEIILRSASYKRRIGRGGVNSTTMRCLAQQRGSIDLVDAHLQRPRTDRKHRCVGRVAADARRRFKQDFWTRRAVRVTTADPNATVVAAPELATTAPPLPPPTPTPKKEKRNIVVTINLSSNYVPKALSERRVLFWSFLRCAKPGRDVMYALFNSQTDAWHGFVRKIRLGVYAERKKRMRVKPGDPPPPPLVAEEGKSMGAELPADIDEVVARIEMVWWNNMPGHIESGNPTNMRVWYLESFLRFHHIFPPGRDDEVGLIIACDSRDTLFQENPFDAFRRLRIDADTTTARASSDGIAEGFYVVAETYPYVESDINRGWYRVMLGHPGDNEVMFHGGARYVASDAAKTMPAGLQNETRRTFPDGRTYPVLCSGLYFGTIAAMREVVNLQKGAISCTGTNQHGHDQPALISVFYHLAQSAKFLPFPLYVVSPFVGGFGRHYIPKEELDVFPRRLVTWDRDPRFLPSTPGAGEEGISGNGNSNNNSSSNDGGGANDPVLAALEANVAAATALGEKVPDTLRAAIRRRKLLTKPELQFLSCDGVGLATVHQLDRHNEIHDALEEVAIEVERSGEFLMRGIVEEDFTKWSAAKEGKDAKLLEAIKDPFLRLKKKKELQLDREQETAAFMHARRR